MGGRRLVLKIGGSREAVLKTRWDVGGRTGGGRRGILNIGGRLAPKQAGVGRSFRCC